MPRLVRRKPLLERVTEYLDPRDFVLWLSEELETRDLDSTTYSVPLALGLHITLLIARANCGNFRRKGDDVFGEDYSKPGWLSSIPNYVVLGLTAFSILNAAYTFLRRRHYRLFESNIDTPQTTPSAHRVRVDSSPLPFASILGDTSAESRAHPDPTQHVWQIAMWDPRPLCLRLFCLFSPGHVLIYWLFLPTLPSDPWPSMMAFKTIFLELLLSSQLLILQSATSLREQNKAVIDKEVMREYDTKYVQFRMDPLVRDVGTQYTKATDESEPKGGVHTYTPTVTLKRGFRTNPNPNYAKHIDPKSETEISRHVFSPATSYTPSAYNSREPTPFTGMTPKPPIRQPQFRQSMGGAVSTGTSTGDGGNLGVFSHANSPLKKATSMYDMQGSSRQSTPRNSFDMAGREIQEQRERERSQSPAKRQSEAPRPLLGLDNDRRTSAPGGFGLKPKPGQQFNSPYKRGPSRF